MTIGKRVKDIPKSVTAKPPHIKGRPQATEPYKKVTVCLFDRHTLFLDKLALEIQERTGQHIRRAELIRALVDHAAAWINPKQENFNTTIRSLLPNLKGGR